MRRLVLYGFGLLLMIGLPNRSFGAGGILVDTEVTGQPVSFQKGTVTFNPETTSGSPSEGRLGRLSNDEAIKLVLELFSDWQNVSIEGIQTVSLSVTQEAGLGNIDSSNVNSHFTYCPPDAACTGEAAPFVVGSARSEQSPILFDADGSITDLIQGEGASNDILGFAGPRVVLRTDGVLHIMESQAVLNGRFVDCPEGATAKDPCRSPEVSLESFKGAIFHELGHFLGLDHVQINFASAMKTLSGDTSELDAIPTMLPLFINGKAQLSPHKDDIVSLSMLYPAPEFEDSFCTIEGKVFESDGTTELQGVNIIARNTEAPLTDSVSFVSGAFYTGDFANCTAAKGTYLLKGIVPGKGYFLEIERIHPTFIGGSSIEPCDPPLSGFEEASISGVFSCSSGGQTIKVGSVATTDIVTTKVVTKGTGEMVDDGGGGCSLIPLIRSQPLTP